MEEAQKIIVHLIDEKLIACGNCFPVTSFYKWKGNTETSSEITAILKTRKDNWNKVKEYIVSNHSYETPCVVRLGEVEANDAFASWVQVETA